jgi:hypothetical protein
MTPLSESNQVDLSLIADVGNQSAFARHTLTSLEFELKVVCFRCNPSQIGVCHAIQPGGVGTRGHIDKCWRPELGL